jgi:hypothetical protein
MMRATSPFLSEPESEDVDQPIIPQVKEINPGEQLPPAQDSTTPKGIQLPLAQPEEQGVGVSMAKV